MKAIVHDLSLISMVILMVAVQDISAQSELCRGSLGENIFAEGGFGEGRDVLVPDDPGIAPGYYYTTYTPPSDGTYTITNNMDRWFRIWPTWLRIGDRSDNPQGYMMVVNASYQPGIFYEQVVDGLCDNTVYEFSADVINLIQRGIPDHIYPNVSFLIDGTEYYTTGPIVQNEEWQHVGFTFSSSPGQTEVRLTLRNNAPGGRGNDIALDNISFRACGPYASINTVFPNVVCENGVFPVLNADILAAEERAIQWQISTDNGESWKDLSRANDIRCEVPRLSPGRYQICFVHAPTKAQLKLPTCRTVSDIFDLHVRPARIQRSVTINAGESFRLGQETYTRSGTYTKTFPSSTGCDSTVSVILTVRGDEMTAKLLATPETCTGRSDGVLRITSFSGGVSPFSFRWSHGARGRQVTGLAAGKYTVTITDRRGVKLTLSETIPAARVLSPSVVSNARTRTAQISVTGGKSPYLYEWSTGATGRTCAGLQSGTYAVTVTDATGCSGAKEFVMPPSPQAPRLIPELSMETLQSGRAVRMDRVQFHADSSTISDESLPTLEELYEFLIEHPEISIEIGGHTNGLPDHAYCDQLSAARAREIAEWIVARGIDRKRITHKGYGKRNPIATNLTPEGRRLNQRVEVRLVYNIE